jgi:phosphoglycerate dehydrogenase-like enzyme
VNILICTTEHNDARRALLEALSGHNVVLRRPAEVSDSLPIADVIIPFTQRIGADELASGNFAFVQQFGAGVEGIDLKAAGAAGVFVANVPAGLYGNADSVAEHAIMLMLALSRRLNYVRQDIVAGRVSDPAGKSLYHKRCCLVGLGDIGVEIARRLHPFGMLLTAVRRNPAQPVYADLRFERILPMDKLGEAMAESDYVVLSLPQTPETVNIINQTSIRSMKPGSFLINVGRGGLIDPDALVSALADGHLAGAGLDVFWQEPVDPAHPLFDYNVIATPHVAGVTDSSCAGIAGAISENIRLFKRGEQPKHLLTNPISLRTRLT